MLQLLEPNVPDWEPGCTEPWVVDLIVALVIASGAQTVLEVGGFTGFASKRIAKALDTRGGKLTVCEIDSQRANDIQTRLDALGFARVATEVICADSLAYIAALEDETLDFTFLDGDHAKQYVDAEIRALWLKMRPRGIIALHDVYGSCDLQSVALAHGGYALDLPRLGPAGGLGIIQVL